MDPFSDYRAGFEVRSYRLCRQILMFHHFPTELKQQDYLVRSMTLGYDEQKHLTYLDSITQTGHIWKEDGNLLSKKSLPPLDFSYIKPGFSREVKEITPDNIVHDPVGLDNQLYQWTDFYSEGIAGILTEQANGWFYKENLGDGKFARAACISPKPNFTGLANGRLSIQELAADGKKYIVQQNAFPKGYFELTLEEEWKPFRPFETYPNIDFKDANLKYPIAGSIAIGYFKFIPYVLPDKVLIGVDDRWDEDGISLGSFLFDGNSLWKSTIKQIEVMPFNYFHKIEQFPPINNSKIFSWQINKDKRANSSIYFENGGSKEFIGGIASARNFFHPYTHDLLGRINLDDFSYFFEYNLGIADKVDAFGKGATNTYNELHRPYSLYNWELFFHVPFQIANELSANQHFEAAMKWYHYIFDPSATGTDPKQCWKFRPFQEMDTDNYLEKIFSSLQPNAPNQEITNWRNNPFQPHAIARTRPGAYMKNVVMKYMDNLLAWGDYLFKQDTLETINYATQLYVLASHICPVATMLPKQGKIKPETYNSLLDKWDAFGNAMVELELVAPYSQQITTSYSSIGNSKEIATANIFGFASSLYFCIPNNPKLMAYRDLIADRLYKIRHCENIDGVFRILPLWDPPIDPALLVAASAQGLSIDNLLNDLNTPIPNYRFVYMIQKAMDLCNEVKMLGNALMSALEKNDGEALAAMRASHETSMHNFVMEVKKMQVDEAGSALEGLQQNRLTTEYRLRHYLQQLGEDAAKIPASGDAFSELSDPVQRTFVESGLRLIADEHEEMDKASTAHWWQLASGGAEVLSGILHALPDQLAYDLIGFVKDGGSHMGKAASEAAKVLQIISSVYAFESANAQKKAGFRRQLQDRILQANLAGYECMQIDKQIASQQIRIQIANQEISNQQHVIDHAAEAEAFIRDKFTNEALYKWMKGQLKATYKQAYDLAWDWAKKAEKVYCFERGLTNTTFLNTANWDAGYEGLLSGEKLFLGLKKLEAAYHDNRGHHYEIIKPVSLLQLDPLAMVELRTTGKCSFNIPEELFDMDFPGHYMRRIKSIALSIPCIAGPYASVNATLRLQEHSYRLSAVTGNTDYARKTGEEDERFASAHIPIAAIATSTGQHDSGVFELNFKDERYMPFEGAGAISGWLLDLPSEMRQFNYDSIADIIIHISYTAKDGGEKLKAPAIKAMQSYIKEVAELGERQGLFAFFDIKNDFPNEWYKALELPPAPAGRLLELGNLGQRLPFFTRGKTINAKDIYIISRYDINPADFVIRYKASALPAFGAVQVIGKTTGVTRIPDLNQPMNGADDVWSLKFQNTIKKPEKFWMIIRYTLK